MPLPSKTVPYKKYQCRYFDERSGQPLTHSGCNQGVSCRFVHPNDPNWPGQKCRPLISPALRHKNSQPFRAKGDRDDRSRRSPDSARASAPLVSQTDLYRRCKMEPKEDVPLNYGDADNVPHIAASSHTFSGQYHDRDYPNSERREADERRRSLEHSRYRDSDFGATESSSAHWADANINPKKGSVEKPSASDKSGNQCGRMTADTHLQDPRGGKQLHVRAAAHLPERDTEQTTSRSESLMQIFREVAALSSQIIHDTALYDQEERKLQTYNEISATLSKVSASAAAAISSPLADTILAHAQNKERLDTSFQTLGNAWEKVFEFLTCEVTQALEGGIQSALSSIKTEADCLMQRMRMTAESGASKRKIHELSPSPVSEERTCSKRHANLKDTGPMHSDQGQSVAPRNFKRRRLADGSRSSSPHLRETHETKSPASLSVDQVLYQVKSKIDEQATSLRVLTRENEELKHQLQNKPLWSHSVPYGSRERTEPHPGTSGRSATDKCVNKYSSHIHDHSDRRQTAASHREARFRGEGDTSK